MFNNWQVVTEGWYIVCPSKDLKNESVLSRTVAGQKVAVFRDSKGQVHAMDGFCPHMGVDLGIGKVVNDRLRCFFHHWEYGTDGRCKHIPIQDEIPKHAVLQTYAVCEKYGFIWVNPNKDTQKPVLDVPGFEGQEMTYVHGKDYERGCHFHITMINGIDPQHLRTVHNIHIDMDLSIEQEDESRIDIELSGPMPDTTFAEKMTKKVLGNEYGYSMKYADGCVAALTILKRVKFFGFNIPELHMIFAYQMIEPGRSHVQPIYLTQKRSGLLGGLKSRFWIFLTKMAFLSLQGEDGQVYENIRFNTQNLLKMDTPVTKYIRYINRLKPSVWSRAERDLEMKK